MPCSATYGVIFTVVSVIIADLEIFIVKMFCDSSLQMTNWLSIHVQTCCMYTSWSCKRVYFHGCHSTMKTYSCKVQCTIAGLCFLQSQQTSIIVYNFSLLDNGSMDQPARGIFIPISVTMTREQNWNEMEQKRKQTVIVRVHGRNGTAYKNTPSQSTIHFLNNCSMKMNHKLSLMPTLHTCTCSHKCTWSNLAQKLQTNCMQWYEEFLPVPLQVRTAIKCHPKLTS